MSLHTLGQKNAVDRLIIFDRFRVDKKLPKFKDEEKDETRSSSKMSSGVSVPRSFNPEDFSDDGEDFDGSVGPGTFTRNSGNITVGSPTAPEPKVPWYLRWLGFKAEKAVVLKVEEPPPPTPVQYVFDLVLNNPEELKVFEDRNLALEKMIENARSMHQGTLLKQLLLEKEVRKFENALVATGRKKVITEAQLLKFVQGCEKGLCLDWVADFIRPIPEEVANAKHECDKIGFFDNYVVLHFDPKNKGTSEKAREAEAIRIKDPILFGVMKGSRKLYFIGDWMDEYCDLTLQKIIDKLAEPLEIK